MTVKIEIIGEGAEQALHELRGLAAGLLGATEAVQRTTLEPDAAEAPEEKPDTQLVPTTVVSRERGKPAPGRARRTKEEIAEDEAAEKTEAVRETASVTRQAISTGEERVDPDAEQDEADEQAEVEANIKPDTPLTADDVRNAFGLYVQKFGMDAVQTDGPLVLADVLGNPPGDDRAWKITTIPAERYGDVIAAFTGASKADQRYKRRGA